MSGVAQLYPSLTTLRITYGSPHGLVADHFFLNKAVLQEHHTRLHTPARRKKEVYELLKTLLSHDNPELYIQKLLIIHNVPSREVARSLGHSNVDKLGRALNNRALNNLWQHYWVHQSVTNNYQEKRVHGAALRTSARTLQEYLDSHNNWKEELPKLITLHNTH